MFQPTTNKWTTGGCINYAAPYVASYDGTNRRSYIGAQRSIYVPLQMNQIPSSSNKDETTTIGLMIKSTSLTCSVVVRWRRRRRWRWRLRGTKMDLRRHAISELRTGACPEIGIDCKFAPTVGLAPASGTALKSPNSGTNDFRRHLCVFEGRPRPIGTALQSQRMYKKDRDITFSPTRLVRLWRLWQK